MKILTVLLMTFATSPVLADALDVDRQGNNAGNAYLVCNEAIAKQKPMVVYNCLSSEMKSRSKANITPDTIKKAIPTMSQFAAKQVAIAKYTEINNRVYLYVTGNVLEARSGKPSQQKGMVTMVMESGQWKVSKEEWGNVSF